MNDNEVSNLLEILDLEYLKPILIDRFPSIGALAAVNLTDVGVQNQDDRGKLRYALDQLVNEPDALDHYDPILSIRDSNHMLTRIENETNLLSSTLNFLLESNWTTLPRDDATSDIDYGLYRRQIEQIQVDVDRLQASAEDLIRRIDEPTVPADGPTSDSNSYIHETLLLISLSVVCFGLMLYVERK